jgi:hypothetical protein
VNKLALPRVAQILLFFAVWDLVFLLKSSIVKIMMGCGQKPLVDAICALLLHFVPLRYRTMLTQTQQRFAIAPSAPNPKPNPLP